MNARKNLRIIWILIACVMAFSADLSPLSELYKTGKVRFELVFVLDDKSMPADLFFESPSTVTCDPEGNIYVVDSGNRRLCAFTPEGEFIESTNISYEEGSVRKLRGFPSGEIVVEKDKTYRNEPDKPQTCTIDLYTLDLKFVRTIYKRELWRKKYVRTKEYVTKLTEFSKHMPVYDNILVDSEGNILVVLNRAQKSGNGKIFDTFSPEGDFISSVISQGEAALPDNHNAYILHNRSLLLLKTGEDDLFRLIRYKISS